VSSPQRSNTFLSRSSIRLAKSSGAAGLAEVRGFFPGCERSARKTYGLLMRICCSR